MISECHKKQLLDCKNSKNVSEQSNYLFASINTFVCLLDWENVFQFKEINMRQILVTNTNTKILSAQNAFT